MRVLAVAVAIALAGTAAAQPAPGPPDPVPSGDVPPLSPAEQAFQDGRTLLDAGRHADACVKFEESIRLDPEAPGTLLNLGLCNERLGKTATALAWFRRAQFRAAETGMIDYEDVAKNSTLSLSVRVPTVRIIAPAGTEVFLDGKQIAEFDLGKIEVDPGPHAIEGRAAGKPTMRADITINDGEAQDVTLTPPAPVAPPPPPVAAKVWVEVDCGLGRRRLAYIIGGGGIALWGGSLAVSLVARSNYNATDRPDEWRSAQQLARFGGTSLFIAGTAAVAGAVFLYVTAPGMERVERTTAVTPVVGGDQLGVVVHGAF